MIDLFTQLVKAKKKGIRLESKRSFFSKNDLSSLMKLIVCERDAITRLFTYLISSNSSFYLSGCSTYPSLSNLVCYSIDLPLGWILGYLRSDQLPICLLAHPGILPTARTCFRPCQARSFFLCAALNTLLIVLALIKLCFFPCTEHFVNRLSSKRTTISLSVWCAEQVA